jgi:hypothetical protein
MMTVECSNCGGIGPEFWLSLAALLFAGVAGWYAKRSADATNQALTLARDEVDMARTEHNEFLRQLQARARLVVELSAKGANDDGVLRMGGTAGTVIVRVGLSNDGERAAGATVINVLVPRRTESFAWCGPNGEPLPDLPSPEPIPETLTGPDGREVEAAYIAAELPRVGLKAHLVRFVKFYVTLPQDRSDVVVPIYARASADELPDDVDEVTHRLDVRIRPTAN